MNFLLGLIPSTWVRVAIVAAVLVFGAAWCFHAGIKYESNERDAQDLKFQRQADTSFGRALAKGAQASKDYLEEKAKREGLETQLEMEIANAQESDLAVSACPAVRSTGPACVFTRYYVRLWNDAWLGGDGTEPVFSDPKGVTAEERQATAFGPRDILKNERVNALSCTEDRARLDKLVDLLDQLEAEWAAGHR